MGVAIAWAALPLGFGLVGFGLAFAGVVLPFVKDDFGQLFGAGVLGSLAGAGLATVHTLWSYWRTYLR
jgi:hypothetical protein